MCQVSSVSFDASRQRSFEAAEHRRAIPASQRPDYRLTEAHVQPNTVFHLMTSKQNFGYQKSRKPPPGGVLDF
jgi:hypothetical protein